VIPFPVSSSRADERLKERPLRFIALAGSDVKQAKQVPFQTIDKGSYSGVRERLQIAIRNQAEWTELWKRHAANKPKQPLLPEINFGQEMVVAVFLGEKPTGGYGIQIIQVAKTDRGVEVSYREQSPAPGAMTIQALTQPFHIVRIPKNNGDEVSFRRLP
jgi:hypothetical protein